MVKSNNGKRQDKRLMPNGDQRRYTGEILRRMRPKTYRAIASELAEPNASVNGISRRYRVSNHTVMGIREREAEPIAERKKTLAAKLANVAEPGAERMAQTSGRFRQRLDALSAKTAKAFLYRAGVFLLNFAPSVSVELVGNRSTSLLHNQRKHFALLRVDRSIFESQMANNQAP